MAAQYNCLNHAMRYAQNFMTLIRKSNRNLLLFVVCFLILLSCKKEDLTPPTIRFVAERECTYTDQAEAIGAQLKTAIVAEAGGAAITNFVVTMKTKNGIETALDSGLYTNQLSYTKNFIFGASDYETWTYKVTDKNGKTASVSFTLTKDTSSTYGLIDYFPSLILGCQEDTTYGPFMVFPGCNTYFQDSAGIRQSQVYLIAYYGNLLSPPLQHTFSSPGDNDVATFYPSISSWTLPKNEVRYKPDSITITPAMFDAATNDSLIISNYTSATVGKRKYKNALPGYVIPFQISIGALSGKRGLIKVISVNGTSAGSIEFALKIQK